MITLSSSTQKLQVLLSGAVSTTECPLTVDYEEKSNSLAQLKRKTALGITTGGTAVDLLSAPASGTSRRIVGFSCYNADTAAVTVTVRMNDNGTTRNAIVATLQTLETLCFSESRGWYAVDVNGNQKSNAPASSGAASTAQSIASAGSSVAASVATLTPASVSSQASSVAAGIVVASINSVSSQASSVAALNPNTISTSQSGASAQSFTSTNWSTVSSATSRVKSSFSW